MTNRKVRLGEITVHRQVVEKIGATRLGCELEAYRLGIRSVHTDPRRRVIFDALANYYEEGVSSLLLPDKTEVWFASSGDDTEVFIPRPIRGRAEGVVEGKLSCETTAARLLTPAQITSVAMRHRNCDWGVAAKSVKLANEIASHYSDEVISIFRFSHAVEAVVTSAVGLPWIHIKARSLA